MIDQTVDAIGTLIPFVAPAGCDYHYEVAITSTLRLNDRALVTGTLHL
jgi:hypothetical protein